MQFIYSFSSFLHKMYSICHVNSNPSSQNLEQSEVKELLFLRGKKCRAENTNKNNGIGQK